MLLLGGKQGRDLEPRRLGSSAGTGIYAPGPVQEIRRLEQRGRAAMAMEARRTVVGDDGNTSNQEEANANLRREVTAKSKC